MRIVLCTGGFDPLHEGHVEYLNSAKKLAMENLAEKEEGLLIVGLNSDAWLARKKGKPFMSWISRSVVLSNLRMVDLVTGFDDNDDTAIDAIKLVKEMYPDATIIFANGGDRNFGNIPEIKWASENSPDIKFEFGVGGDEKVNSSSWILENWKDETTSA